MYLPCLNAHRRRAPLKYFLFYKRGRTLGTPISFVIIVNKKNIPISIKYIYLFWAVLYFFMHNQIV
jgi:hypothetical protein